MLGQTQLGLKLAPLVVTSILLLLARSSGQANGQQQFSADQASNAISVLLKPNQQSACDGEQLNIKCNDDYVIEIITAELTVLEGEQHRSQGERAASSGDSTATSGSGANICPPLPGDQAAGVALRLANDSRHTRNTAGANWQPLCDKHEAHELASSSQAKFVALIRKQCALMNTCTLDFGILEPPTTANNHTGGEFAQFARFLGDKCPANRKLAELVYKCRPSKVKSRAACRNGRLALECPPGENGASKRLAIGSAVYGFWNDDKRTHEKCLAEEERSRPAGVVADRATMTQPPPPVASALINAKNCTTLGAQPLSVVANECLFKQQCHIQLKPQLFRNADAGSACPANQLEYLKVIYVCVSDELLLTTNSSSLARGANQSAPVPPFSSSAATSSLLSASSSSARNMTSQFIRPAAAADDADNSDAGNATANTRPPPVTMTILADTGQESAPASQSAYTTSVPRRTGGQQDAQDTGGRVYAVVAADPQLSSLPPSQWSVGQRVKFVLLRYQTQIVALSVITLTVFTLSAFLVRVCRAGGGSARSRNSTTSSSSSKSTGSSDTSKSFALSSTSGDYAHGHTATVNSHHQLMGAGGGQASHTLLAPGHHKHQHHGPRQHQQPLQSCSESCFSLDDFLCNHQHQRQATGTPTGVTGHMHHMHQHQNQHRPAPLQVGQFQHSQATNSSSSANNSPALQSQHTTPPVSANEHMAPAEWPGAEQHQAARPKFWSFYGNEQQAGTGSLRAASFNQQSAQQQQPPGGPQAQLAATMQRPQRSFGQRQRAPMARNFLCLQQQQPIAAPSLPVGSEPPALEQHQGDYLLAMAAVQQQREPAGAHWCQAHGQTTGQLSVQLNQLSAAELELQQQPTAAQQPTCAFHQQQQQQLHLVAHSGQAALELASHQHQQHS